MSGSEPKRHIAVDTQRLPHAIHVTTAEVTDRDGALAMSTQARKDQWAVVKILADGGYTGPALAAAVRHSFIEGVLPWPFPPKYGTQSFLLVPIHKSI